MKISVNGLLTDCIGETIEKFVKAAAEAEEISNEMNAIKDGYGDAFGYAIFSMTDAYGELLKAYITDAVDAQVAKDVITSYQQAKSYQHSNERKAK